MKFRHAYRGHGRIVYFVRPGTRWVDQGLIRSDKGLTADFVEGFFDSEKAQKLLGWSDEERDLVERFLMDSDAFGRGMYLDPSEPGAKAAPEPIIDPVGDLARVPETVCIASVEREGESGMCGKPTVDGEFCAKHHEEFAAAEAGV